MTTQEKIDAILINRYGSLTNLHSKRMQYLFRNQALIVPFPFWKLVINGICLVFTGRQPFKSKRLITDEHFLDFLQKQESENPRPVYGSGIILS